MKKIIISTIIISLTFFIVNHFNKPKQDNTFVPKNQNPIKEKVEDINVKQIELGLYKYHGKNKERELIKEHKSVWEYHKDIESFEVFYTKQQFIDSNYFQDTFKKYYEFYKDIDNYKIGYHIKFQTIENEINKYILSPKDTEEFYEYLEIYLYDDYHREKGVWYSHTTEEEMNGETLLTSIKLTAGKQIEYITSPIELSVFTYESLNFLESNNYEIANKYSIIVYNSNN